jgi:hypothetical protein
MMDYHSENLQFIDSIIIIGNDTTLIPIILPLNKKISFTGCSDDNICYSLDLTRINYSTLQYAITKNEARIKCYTETGNADLDHNFNYLDKDDEYDNEIKYYASNKDSCNITIRIGNNNENKLCAKIQKSFCKHPVNDIYNCITLYCKNK